MINLCGKGIDLLRKYLGSREFDIIYNSVYFYFRKYLKIIINLGISKYLCLFIGILIMILKFFLMYV